jgi:hypothetical protein
METFSSEMPSEQRRRSLQYVRPYYTGQAVGWIPVFCAH